jgi:hypothetical protein
VTGPVWHNYLRRSPDDAPNTNYDGFDFWLAKLNQFNGDYRQAENGESVP